MEPPPPFDFFNDASQMTTSNSIPIRSHVERARRSTPERVCAAQSFGGGWRRRLYLLIAATCKLAIVLCLVEPCVEGLVKPEGAEEFRQECRNEEHERATSIEGMLPAPANCLQRKQGAVFDAGGRSTPGNALARTSKHVLANGLCAPLLC